MRSYFCKVPNSHYLRAWDLVRDVNCGKEVFLMDISIRTPHSLVINPSKPKGGNRLRRGEAVLVTNESMLWLVSIGRNHNGNYLARCESHSSRPSESQVEVSRIPESVDPAILRNALARFRNVDGGNRQVLARPARNVQRRSPRRPDSPDHAQGNQVLQPLPDGALR